jgi:hypothetical protein
MRCELRISWVDTNKTDVDVVRILNDLNVSATVTNGLSVCRDDSNSEKDLRRIERSVIIDLYDVEKNKIVDVIWPELKNKFNLTCAHVHEDGAGFSGCILDYDIPSRCPWKILHSKKEQSAQRNKND